MKAATSRFGLLLTFFALLFLQQSLKAVEASLTATVGSQSYSLNQTTGTFSVTQNGANGVRIFYFSGTDSMYLDFIAPYESWLKPGVYTNAGIAFLQPIERPGFSIWGATQGGTTFQVKKIVYGSYGAIISFWATFQNVNTFEPVAGEIKYNVDSTEAAVNQPPIVYLGADKAIAVHQPLSLSAYASDDNVPGPTIQTNWQLVRGPGSVSFQTPTSQQTSATFSAPGVYLLELVATDGERYGCDDITVRVTDPNLETSLRVNSSADDPVGRGESFNASAATDAFEVYLEAHQGILIKIQGEHRWRLGFAAPPGSSLQVGEYTGAVGYPTVSGDKPALVVYRDGYAAGTPTGSFTVKQIVYGLEGNIQSFHVEFEQRALNSTGSLRGELKFNVPTKSQTSLPPNAGKSIGSPNIRHEVLVSFAEPGSSPGQGALTLAEDGFFWGTTQFGGAYDCGTVFKVKPDGSEKYTLLSFSENGSGNRGKWPDCKLWADGNGYLWGTTRRGGAGRGMYGWGTIFKVQISTGVLTTVYQFPDDKSKDIEPNGALVGDESGGLWGTTGGNSLYNRGSVFRFDRNTGELATIVNFNEQTAQQPIGGLTEDGTGNLWGVTLQGGLGNGGTIFKVNRTTGAFSTVANIGTTPASSNCKQPIGPLLKDANGFMWGTTRSDIGYPAAIFKVNISTGEFTKVHQWAADEITWPTPLALDDDGSIWGAVKSQHINTPGSIYKLDPEFGHLRTVVYFSGNGTSARGAYPLAPLISDGAGNLFGTTSTGAANENGTVYCLEVLPEKLKTLMEFTEDSSGVLGCNPTGDFISASGGLWGVTQMGGASGFGTIYKFDPATNDLTTVVEFTDNGRKHKGAFPSGGLFQDQAGILWGTTSEGGVYGKGTVYNFNPETSEFTTAFSFNGNTDDAIGAYPHCELVSDSNGWLWGTTLQGGSDNKGSVFKINPATHEVQTVVNFKGDHRQFFGALPGAGLVADNLGYFWGTTTVPGGYNGPGGSPGSIFKVRISDGNFFSVRRFGSATGFPMGYNPEGELTLDDNGFLWGTTTMGGRGPGVNGSGTVFKVDVSTGVPRTMVEFMSHRPPMGEAPACGLLIDGNKVWGTSTWGPQGFGSIYQIDRATGESVTVLNFTGNGTQPVNGMEPCFSRLFKHSDGHIYGITQRGGAEGGGTIFRLVEGSEPITLPATNVIAETATLQGTIDPNGVQTAAKFIWGTNPNLLTESIAAVENINPDATSVNVSAEMTGLLPSTTYYFRVVSVKPESGIQQAGVLQTFTTLAPKPLVGTIVPGEGAEAGPDEAFLTANVNTNGMATTVRFYLEGILQGSVNIPENQSTVVASFKVTGLTPATIYSYNATAESASGLTTGEIVRFSTAVSLSTVARSADAVPNAGVPGSGVPAMATWKDFGAPMINDARQIAYVARWTSPSGPGAAILIDEKIVVKTGDSVPGLPDTFYKDFKDPVINSDGRFVCITTIQGHSVSKKNNSIILSDGFDPNISDLQVLARTGSAAAGTAAVFKAFSEVAVHGSGEDGAIVLTATLATISNQVPVSVATNSGVWMATATNPSALFLCCRKGTNIPGVLDNDKIQSVKLLTSFSGTLGHGRAFGIPKAPAFTATLSSRRHSILQIGQDPAALLFSGTTANVDGHTDLRWRQFGPLSTSADGFSMKAEVYRQTRPGQISKITGIFCNKEAEGEWSLIAANGDSITENSSIRFSGFGDPVMAGDRLAFSAMLKEPGVNTASNQAIFYKISDGDPAALVREGGARGSLIWKQFISLAMPGGDRGPLFTAHVQQRQGSRFSIVQGIWATNSAGIIQTICNTGDLIDGKKVRNVSALRASLGSNGVSRNFNNVGDIAWLVEFTDGSRSIQKTFVP